MKLIYPDKEAPKWVEPLINATFVTLCCIMKNIPGLKPDDITNFNGAICLFFIVYLIPIMMHLMCYHGDK